MDIRIDSNFQFSVVSIKCEPCGGLCITLKSDVFFVRMAASKLKTPDKCQKLAKKMYLCT